MSRSDGFFDPWFENLLLSGRILSFLRGDRLISSGYMKWYVEEFTWEMRKGENVNTMLIIFKKENTTATANCKAILISVSPISVFVYWKIKHNKQ